MNLDFSMSPLSKKQAEVDLPTQELICPVDIYSVSPMAKIINPNAVTLLPVSQQDIDNLGKGLTTDVMKVSEKFMKGMSLVDADELGHLMAQFNNEASRLDIGKTDGVIGWLRSFFSDIKTEAYRRVTTVEKSFLQLTEKMNDQVARHKKWQGILSELYQENMNSYARVRAERIKAEELYARCKAIVDSLPEISPSDPDAVMKGQMILEAKSFVARIHNRVDNLARLQVCCENNAPKILAQRENSQVTIETVTDIIEQALPLIKLDFLMLAQSKDVLKSNKVTESGRELLNRSILKSTDGMVEASVQTAEIANTPNIQTATIIGVRERMTDMISRISAIEYQQQERRIADAKVIQDSQAQLLNAISSR